MKSKQAPVAIVGGGYSGTIIAAQLARRGIASILIDGSGRMGRGVAYSTTENAHLLNVRAEGMSAWAGEPDHFAKHFEADGGHRRGFAQRMFFGRYLADILNEAVESGKTELLHEPAVSAQRENGPWQVRLADGNSIEADRLVLAVGNQEPEALRPLVGVGDRLINNPWGEQARAAIAEITQSGASALLVGTGLTMVDLVLSLDAAGHRGRIVALSRRGLAPRAHAEFEPAPVEMDEVPQGSVRALTTWLRKRAADVGWRAAIDSLRPYSQSLWLGLDGNQQQRFLRHARPWWDVHRHRIAPEVADIAARAVADGRLEIVAGRILASRITENGIEVEYRRRGAGRSHSETFAYAFNCTGPLHSVERTKDPLLRSLLDAKEVRADQLGIGLDVDSQARAGERLWAIGPLTKGRYWEIVAVPDIREQAAAVADSIERSLAHD